MTQRVVRVAAIRAVHSSAVSVLSCDSLSFFHELAACYPPSQPLHVSAVDGAFEFVTLAEYLPVAVRENNRDSASLVCWSVSAVPLSPAVYAVLEGAVMSLSPSRTFLPGRPPQPLEGRCTACLCPTLWAYAGQVVCSSCRQRTLTVAFRPRMSEGVWLAVLAVAVVTLTVVCVLCFPR